MNTISEIRIALDIVTSDCEYFIKRRNKPEAIKELKYVRYEITSGLLIFNNPTCVTFISERHKWAPTSIGTIKIE